MTTVPNNFSWLGLSLYQASAVTPATIYLAAWAFAFGAVIGSFLNVVIWRMPLGKSIVAPRSRCPKCRSAIRGYDNIPIVSWLILLGKCRDCKVSISPRYPIVEFCVGVLVLLLATVEGMTGGLNLPVDSQLASAASIWWGWSAMGLHTLLLLTLFCQTMILFDGKSVPRRMYLLSMFAAVMVPLAFAGVRPVAVSTAVISNHFLAEFVSTIAGVSAGIIVGWLCLPATANEQHDRLSTVWAFAICGLALGWQATIAIGVFSSVGYFASKFALYLTGIHQRSPRSAMTFLVSAGYVLCWGDITAAMPQMGLYMNATTLCGATLAVAVVSLATSWLPQPRPKKLAADETIRTTQSSRQNQPDNDAVVV